jgi:hypothetical protein
MPQTTLSFGAFFLAGRKAFDREGREGNAKDAEKL